MHLHRTLFDKYHPGYFEKVGVRYFQKHRNLSKQRRTRTSSLQNDFIEKIGMEEEEEETLGYNLNDEAPLKVQFEDAKVLRNNGDQVFDKSPQQNETGVNELQSIKKDEEEETLPQLEYGKPEEEKLEDYEYQMLDQIIQRYEINVTDVVIDLGESKKNGRYVARLIAR
ncbi:hypothetical protein RND71_019257 [Anisodus tanguticus]|uniref:Uncharacterized protein n=1 Tax=Anisodus tanguticus TaxID=243964 RepID=A0AAE1RYP7_9SOLA|nr:hypothetical protein RND71_019257 [Anisodus tanguticus]